MGLQALSHRKCASSPLLNGILTLGMCHACVGRGLRRREAKWSEYSKPYLVKTQDGKLQVVSGVVGDFPALAWFLRWCATTVC